MVYGSEFVLLLGLCSVRGLDLDIVFFDQNVGVVTVTVQNPDVQDGYLLDLFHGEAIGSVVSNGVIAGDECLERSVLSLALVFQFKLTGTFNRAVIEVLISHKRGVVKLDVGCRGDAVKTLAVQKIGSHFSGSRLPRKNSLSKPLAPELTDVLPRVIWSERLLVVGFKNSNVFEEMVLQEVTA